MKRIWMAVITGLSLLSSGAYADCGLSELFGDEKSPTTTEKKMDGVEAVRMILKAQPYKTCNDDELLSAGLVLWILADKDSTNDLPQELNKKIPQALKDAESEIHKRGLD